MWPISDSLMWELGTFDLGRPVTVSADEIEDRPYGFQSTYEASVPCEVEPLHRFQNFIHERLDLPYSPRRNPAVMRSPVSGYSIYKQHRRGDTVSGWHNDGTEWNRYEDYLIVWSNHLGTEIKVPGSDKIYRTVPGTVYAFHNGSMLHRGPRTRPNVKNRVRWFARSNVRDISLVRDLPGVFALDL